MISSEFCSGSIIFRLIFSLLIWFFVCFFVLFLFLCLVFSLFVCLFIFWEAVHFGGSPSLLFLETFIPTCSFCRCLFPCGQGSPPAHTSAWLLPPAGPEPVLRTEIPWILLLLQTNQDLCLSCGRICASSNLICWQLPCSPTLLSLFLDALSASLLTSHAESLHLLWILLKDSIELGSSNRNAVIFIYFFTPHPLLLFIFSISAPLSTRGQAQSVCQRDPNPLSASLPGSQHIWCTYSLPSKLGLLRQRLRCCPVISPLVPLHSHLLGRGAVSLLDDGLQCIMCTIMVLQWRFWHIKHINTWNVLYLFSFRPQGNFLKVLAVCIINLWW